MAYDFLFFFFFLCPKRFRFTRVMVVAFASHWQDVKESFNLETVTTRSNTWHCWDNIRRTKDSEPHSGFFVKRSTKQGHFSARHFQILRSVVFQMPVFELSVPWFQLISLNYHLHSNHWFCGIVGPLMRNSSLVCAWQLVISVCSRFVIMQ